MRGLVLSGGGAFGPYQVGAWRELRARDWTPDIVTGISIGAVNGFMIARGVGADEMLTAWRDWPGEMLPRHQKRFSLPWTAYTQLFEAWLVRVAETFGPRPLRADYRVVALELPAFRLRLFEQEAVQAEALRGACALPGVLPPGRIDGRWVIDCGAARHLPLKEAKEAGARDIVAVDLLERHPLPPARLLRKGFQAFLDAVHQSQSNLTDAELAEIRLQRISRPGLLGGLLDSFRWSPEAVDQLVSAGESDAAERLGPRRQATTPANASAKNPAPVNPAPQNTDRGR